MKVVVVLVAAIVLSACSSLGTPYKPSAWDQTQSGGPMGASTGGP